MGDSVRHRLYDILEPGSRGDTVSIAFDRFCTLVILASIACAVMSTEPSLGPDWQETLRDAEYVFGTFFTIEYALRLWTASEHPLIGKLSPVRSRLQLATEPLLIL